MIFTAILGLLFSFAAFVFALFPAFDGPTVTEEMTDAAGSAGSKLNWLSLWFNLDLLLTLGELFMVILAAFLIVKAITWVASKIPFLGMSDT